MYPHPGQHPSYYPYRYPNVYHYPGGHQNYYPHYYQPYQSNSTADGIQLSPEDKARMDKLSIEAFTCVKEMQKIVAHYLRQNPRAKYVNFNFTRVTEKHGLQGYDRIVFQQENPDGGVLEDGMSCGQYIDPPGICKPC
ncbi:hypothetical protein ABEV00_28525 [Paenibacillus thiaminolyticus]|uniref:hypothetical protein n=1 Tax=Paenibacillus TaxID=44249 RepID=UPI00387E0E0C